MSLFWTVIRQLAEIGAMATSKKVITKEEWEKKLNDVKIRKEDVNKLVMNFLVTEGFVDAAEKFRIESGTARILADIDLATITDRMAVKKAVQCGNVEDAIEKVNDLNPEIENIATTQVVDICFSCREAVISLALSSFFIFFVTPFSSLMLLSSGFNCLRLESINRNSLISGPIFVGAKNLADLFCYNTGHKSPLVFPSPQQRFIELIRNGKIEEALEFAQESLHQGEKNQSFLEELERTVSLLAFEDVSNCPVGELLDISQRLKTASEVNAAILTSQSHEKDPKLPSLLKMLIWAQNQLDKKAAYPHINDLSTAILEDPAI
ncbi:hypothetical protein I3842_09G053700 [Carya illinoinensis]|uniref:CTLH domain-containing protein n=1 Tax=Carya illinoinensis TaxID=32201 RepID=A0A922E2H4_CARIL|nr:hypothetical protein I3842_09G053700 [Carya illinoinensis]